MIVIAIQEINTTGVADFMMLFVSIHSLPWSREALELAAGVRKARCTPMTTMITES